MNRIGWLSPTVALAAMVLLISCSTRPEVVGLWQSTEDEGTLELTSTGEVVVTDNLSATVTGRYEIEDDGSIRLELTGSDILRDSIQPTPKTIIRARVELAGDELTLLFDGGRATERYRRIR